MARSEFSKELRLKTNTDIENTLSDKKMELLRMRNDAIEGYKVTAKWINTKKDVARCLSILTEKKKEEIKAECIKTGKPLPKTLRPKQPRSVRVSIPKEMLKKYGQCKSHLKKKVVVFTP
ncbi:large subunit ribosomal protein L35e [Nematocida displodere]|uniref:Large subunit ribosomal protein L35e n=1 Tax=Nematocida displodere TaxID=1805483 RepID=A0A177EAI0_9MICR|nr:large subunit ribosomal protein L35e [Nematocida displodere]